MAKRQRQLIPLNNVGAYPFGYRCDQCGRVFKLRADSDAGRTAIRAEFDSHNCHEDANQAAFRGLTDLVWTVEELLTLA